MCPAVVVLLLVRFDARASAAHDHSAVLQRDAQLVRLRRNIRGQQRAVQRKNIAVNIAGNVSTPSLW